MCIRDSINTLLQALDRTTSVSVGVNQLTLMVSFEGLNLFVREHDITSESLSHEKILTKSTGASP